MSENKIEFITRNNLIDEVKIPLKVIMHKAKHVYTEDNVKEFLEFSSTCLSLINKRIKFNFIVYAFRSTHFDSFNKLVVTLTLFHNDDVYSIRMESSKDTNTMLVFDSTGIYTEGNDSLISIKRLTNDERRKYIIYHSLYSNPNLYIIPPFTRTSSLVFISDKKYTIKITLFNGTNELCVLNSLCNIAEELVKNNILVVDGFIIKLGKNIKVETSLFEFDLNEFMNLPEVEELKHKVIDFKNKISTGLQYANSYLSNDYVEKYIKSKLPSVRQYLSKLSTLLLLLR